MKRRMKGEGSPSRRRSDVAVPLLFSLLLHGAVLLTIFHGGQARSPASYSAPMAQRLSYLDEYVFENPQYLLAGYDERTKRLSKAREKLKLSRWTLDNMSKRINMLASKADLKLKRVEIVPGSDDEGNGNNSGKASSGRGRHTILVEMISNPDDVLSHILTLANIVGEGTLYSNFLTDKLRIIIRENRSSAPISFVIPTRDCRLLFRDKTSPQEFLVGGMVEAGES